MIGQLPNLMKKDKDQKNSKREAFMSFLQTSATPVAEITLQSTPPIQPPKEGQDPQECYEEDEGMGMCAVCDKDLSAVKKKKCGFCGFAACKDHLRKKRMRKGKFQKICDNCEDQALYDIYGKLEAKAEEAFAVEQQITTLKHENFKRQLDQRTQNKKEITVKTKQLKQTYEQEETRVRNEQISLMSLQHTVESLQLSVAQMQKQVSEMQSGFKKNCEQDFNLLSQQNSRQSKELAKWQKKCLEVRMGIEKRQKQIEEAYERWSRRQSANKTQAGNPAGCLIY